MTADQILMVVVTAALLAAFVLTARSNSRTAKRTENAADRAEAAVEAAVEAARDHRVAALDVLHQAEAVADRIDHHRGATGRTLYTYGPDGEIRETSS